MFTKNYAHFIFEARVKFASTGYKLLYVPNDLRQIFLQKANWHNGSSQRFIMLYNGYWSDCYMIEYNTKLQVDYYAETANQHYMKLDLWIYF